MGECKLCGKDGVKLVKSHIIPRSLYGSLLDGGGGPARLIPHDLDKHPKKSPVGAYDANILCESCEASLAAVDDYAARIFAQMDPEELIIDGQHAGLKICAVDRKKLKLFFISLVWRMHVTNHDFFSNVNLGPLEKLFRKAIQEADPDGNSHVDVVVSRFDDPLATAFLAPHRLVIDKINGYRVGFAGHSCWIKVDGRPFSKSFKSIALNQNDDLVMLEVPFKDSPEFRAMVEILRRRAG